MALKRPPSGSVPEVNLIPMLTVMLGVLAFFVMISATLSDLKVVDVDLPGEGEPQEQQEPPPDPLVVRLNPQNQLQVNEEPQTKEQMLAQVQAYIQQNDRGNVYLTANPDVEYEQVVQILGEMRTIGGDRVALAVEEEADAEAESPTAEPGETEADAAEPAEAEPDEVDFDS